MSIVHEDSESNEMRRKPRVYCFLCILGIMLLVAAIMWIYCFSHDWNLWQLDRSYSALKHPSGTRIIRHHKEIGLLVGNGNHCDYFVGDLRTYFCDKSSVVKYYKNKTIWNPISRAKQNVAIVFIDDIEKFQQENSGLYSTESCPVSIFAKYIPRTDKKHYYIVYILDPGYPTGLDIRGC